MKGDFHEIFHQQAANRIDSDQNTELIFAESKNYHQIVNAYLQYELTIEKGLAVVANRVLANGHAFTLVNNAFAYCF